MNFLFISGRETNPIQTMVCAEGEQVVPDSTSDVAVKEEEEEEEDKIIDVESTTSDESNEARSMTAATAAPPNSTLLLPPPPPALPPPFRRRRAPVADLCLKPEAPMGMMGLGTAMLLGSPFPEDFFVPTTPGGKPQVKVIPVLVFFSNQLIHRYCSLSVLAVN